MVKLYKLLIAAAFAGAIGTPCAWAADPDLGLSGSGTAADPYQVGSKADVLALAKACNGESGITSGKDCGHYAGKYFVMTNDINLEGDTTFLGIGTAPHGSNPGSSWHFDGVFDGRGHKVSGMTVGGTMFDASGKAVAAGKSGSRRYNGLFGYLGAGAVVKNVTVDASCRVSSLGYTGGIAGYVDAGAKIDSCASYAAIDCYDTYAGGIAGYVYATSKQGNGTVSNCLNAGTVRCLYQYAGGIVGYNRGTVNQCLNDGSVKMYSFNAYRESGKQTTGGGIVGYNYGLTTNCLNTGSVWADKDIAGGIAGYNYSSSATLYGCVNLGTVTSSTETTRGTIVGRVYNGSTIENCYYDSQLWGDAAAQSGSLDGANGLTTTQLTSGSALAGLDAKAWKFAAGFYPELAYPATERSHRAAATYMVCADGETAAAFSTKATISTAMTGITATLSSGKYFKVDGNTLSALDVKVIATDTVTLANGDYSVAVPITRTPNMFDGAGTEADPYRIATKADLMNLAELCNGNLKKHFEGEYFKMTADIDMENDPTFTGIASKAIYTYVSEPTYYFAGHFDGGGHTISRMKVHGMAFDAQGKPLNYSGGSADFVGLFGCLASGSSVKNVTLDSTCVIEGYCEVGGIAGKIHDGSSIENCHVAATIDCYDNIGGGIAGEASAETGSLTLHITGCSFSGKLRVSRNYAGGIVGLNDAVITGCANTGSVSSINFGGSRADTQEDAGGIAGSNRGNIANCFNAGTVYAQTKAAGGISGFNSNGMRRGDVTGCVNVGSVSSGLATKAGAIIGEDYRVPTSLGTIELKNNYYDKQLSGARAAENVDKEGFTALSTKQLTSGAALTGLDAYQLAAGFYPIPSSLKAIEAVHSAAATYVTLADGENKQNVHSEATISTALPVKASLSGKAFTLSGSKLAPVASTTTQRDTLTLTCGGFTRAIDLQSVPAILQGAGTAADPYKITSVDDYNHLAALIAESGYAYGDSHFLVTTDLNFTGKPVKQMGSGDLYFAGSIDGGSHTLSGITLTADSVAGGSNVALFGGLAPSGEIKNLKIANTTISGYANVAALVANNQGRVSRVTLDSSVSVTATRKDNTLAGANVGGIEAVAYATSVVDSCETSASVSGLTYVGGIAGYTLENTAAISNCVNRGTVVATAPVKTTYNPGSGTKTEYVDAVAGGIAGKFGGEVSNCRNEGSVSTAKCNVAGGIVGDTYVGSLITDCANSGEVTAAFQTAGGIVGTTGISTAYEVIIANCTNSGTVKAATVAGGIAGTIKTGCSVTSCSNTGEVAPTGTRAGGIAGNSAGSPSISQCYNTGEVSGAYQVGGILGMAESATAQVSQCYNAGHVQARLTSGMVAGIANGMASITSSYNVGNIQGSKYVGGIVGYTTNAKVSQCYNTGEITLEKEGGEAGCISATAGKASVTGCMMLHRSGNEFAADSVSGITAGDAYAIIGGSKVLGSHFAYNALCFPMVKGLDNTDAAKAHAAYFMPGETDTDTITASIELASLEGVTWTATGALSIDGNKAVPTGNGAATITATAGDYSVSYTFEVKKATGITLPEADDPIVATEYYTTAGMRVAEPQAGTVVIAVGRTASGKRVVTKMIAR